MSNQYTITKKIHDNLKKVCEKYNLEKLEIESDYYFDKKGQEWSKDYELISCDVDLSAYTPAIQSPQIRQILKHLQEVLGENPEYSVIEKNLKANVKKVEELIDKNENIDIILARNQGELFAYYWTVPEKLSKALCQKWLNYRQDYTRMIDSEPETVLTELNKILENKIN